MYIAILTVTVHINIFIYMYSSYSTEEALSLTVEEFP